MSAEDRRPTITPQLALRVALIGGVALTMFAIVFFRLWYLQVLSGDEYSARARDNRVRSVTIGAPRGEVVDRNGRVLVGNRLGIAVQLDSRSLPPLVSALTERYRDALSAAERDRLARGARLARRVPVPPLPAAARALRLRYRRLGEVLGSSVGSIHHRVIEGLAEVPYSRVTLAADVDAAAYAYLLERRVDFPGVSVEPVYLRTYPNRALAAQILGNVGEVSPAELKRERFRGVKQGALVGKGGLEWRYDEYLRGRPGAALVQVDALGRPKGTPARSRQDPESGKRLRLSLDLDLQREGEQALRRALGAANRNGNPARAGAFVALAPRTGEVLAIGSYPSFDPQVFTRPISRRRYESLFGEQAGSPQVNRAIAARYPTGSTFKPITATAALEQGLITPESVIHDPGKIEIGDQVFKNAGQEAHGTIALRRALQVSSDVFFYRLGQRANGLDGQVIQRWAARLGLGRRTGIDLPGEFGGLIPDARWRNAAYRRYRRCQQRGAEGCGFVDRPWSVGDNVQLSVGQGDLQATPLQMAVAYAAIATGRRVTPHVGLRVEQPDGSVLQELAAAAPRRVPISASTRRAILDGLRLAASAEGTSGDVFAGFPYPVYGKTGTAERQPRADQSWYVAYLPARRRSIVVAVTIEEGGWGAEAAAPAARLMLSEWLGVPKRWVVGKSRTN